MPSVTWPGASSSVWYQPISLAWSSACTAHTLNSCGWRARRFERARDRVVVRRLGVARGGFESASPEGIAQAFVARQPAHGSRKPVGRLLRRVDQAVLLVDEVLARTAGAAGDHGTADR